MFETLKERLEGVFKRLGNRGKLTEDDISQALRDVRRALLEGDVNYKIAKSFVAGVREKLLEKRVIDSVTPGQQVMAVVYEELTALMGGRGERLQVSPKPPSRYLFVGLQGSGKTTSCVKVAKNIARGHKPLVVACDLRRPAAVKQLEVLAGQERIGFFGPGEKDADALSVARSSIDYAAERLHDVVIYDTAGRLQVDEELMGELESLKTLLKPTEILLVLDAMTGQEALNVASAFHERLGVTGLVLTKMDGDARGGAALSALAVTGVPVKFAGVGERPGDLEEFDASRMAQRILGMGDVQGLAEKVREASEQGDMERMAKTLQKKKMTMEDLLQQIRQVKKMGPLEKVLEMLPGAGQMKQLKNAQVDPKRLARTEAVILSMTPAERRNPQIIKGSRRRRIANGSGTSVQMVNQVLKQFQQMNMLMKRMGKMKKGKGVSMPGGFPPFPM